MLFFFLTSQSFVNVLQPSKDQQEQVIYVIYKIRVELRVGI